MVDDRVDPELRSRSAPTINITNHHEPVFRLGRRWRTAAFLPI
jgi:hypothetical protein